MAVIVDVSQSGVALSLTQTATVPVGTPVTVGATRGRVVRLFANGLAVEFTRVIPTNEFSDDVEL